MALFTTSVALAGCVPLQQYQVSGTHQYEHLSVDGSYFIGQFGSPQVPKTKRIIPTESYALSPKGEKFKVTIEPHDYDISRNAPYIRDRIYLVRDSGRRLSRIGDGDWKLFIMLESAEDRELREITATVRTFNYHPIIHGPPN